MTYPTFSRKPSHFKTIELSENNRTIELWGGSAKDVENMWFQPGDLVINATKRLIPSEKNLIPRAPSWCDNIVQKYGKYKIDIIDLEWPDGSEPCLPVEFWHDLTDLLIQNKDVKRVICCCAAGLGRTGTMLSLLVGIFADLTAEEAILLVRKDYDRDAVEQMCQEEYIFECFGEDIPDEWWDMHSVYSRKAKNKGYSYTPNVTTASMPAPTPGFNAPSKFSGNWEEYDCDYDDEVGCLGETGKVTTFLNKT